MKFYRNAALTLAFAAVLSGCGGSAPRAAAPEPVQEAAQAAAIQSQPGEYTLYYRQNYPLGMYEPETGCYTGAYVLSNIDINFDIAKFDDMTGKTHAAAVYNLRAGAMFPENWVIGCVAAKKTPYFVITPPNEYNPYDMATAVTMAKSFGKFTVPMFVEFYPLNGAEADPAAYISYFRYARAQFRQYAPSAAFVWAVDAKIAADSDAFYPGGAFADWVGLHSIEPLAGGGYGPDMFNAVDYIYYTYQKTKPIVISQFAVSHYSNGEYIYQNQIAADEIGRVYGRVINQYPRIKMINYMDFDESMSDAKKKSDYYTVTENSIVLTAYKDAVADSRFLSSVDSGARPRAEAQLMRSPFPVLRIGEAWYASEYSFMYDFNTKGSVDERQYNGLNYYNMGLFLQNSGKSLMVDDVGRNVTLEDHK